ncbi:MAG: PSD1 domain-containing protein [Planctomycetes bacterium]|nr:PSD1 domain-containing protein [Planctomycetota bacterium]
MPRILLVAAAFLCLAWPGATRCCRADETSPAPADLEFFEKKIRPLLSQRCLECHADRGKGVKGGLSLDTRDGLQAGGDSGPVISTENFAESSFLKAINYGQDSVQMPPRGKLPQDEIDLLTEWVRRGAPFPVTTQPAGASKSRKGIDFDAGKQFWSFQPLQHHPRPAVQRADWCVQPIDAYILAALEAQGMAPSPAADRRTLLRRLSFDLTGLPPTLEELAAFEADNDPNAYNRQVERLLASPHYGERWGRFWLDIVRYCDVAEPWSSDKDARAWLYRDWVVQALNRDVRFDRFLELQLAADLLPDAQANDIAALGFLGLSPVYWKELKLDQAVIKSVIAEEWEERINTLSGAVLGLTMACARCHDHKYDPISQEDYYAWAGVLASLKLSPRALLPQAEAQMVYAARDQIAQWQRQREELLAKRPETDENKQQAAELAKKMAELEQATPHLREPLAYAVEEASLHVLPDGPDRTRLDYRMGEPQDVAIQVRGNPSLPGAVVPRRFLTVLSPGTPVPYREGSGRRELARSFVTEGAPLTARVIVNRIWQQHFGKGLVETPSNFGTTGALPSHPALFEDLVARFVESGWSLKWLHREIVLSSTYRQSSQFDAGRFAIDPENRLLWRAPRKRLDVEAWRDALLAASGRLDLKLGGADRSLDDPENNRRTLYGTVKRRELHAMLRLNDFPDPTTHNASRDLTTTPLQQLFVLNSPFMQQQATALADRVCREVPGDLDGQITRAYQLLFGRSPTARQLQLSREFFASATAPDAKVETWKQYAQALLGSNEAAYLD